MAGVLILFRQLYHPGAHRVEVKVTHQFGQITIAFTEDGLVSLLEKMAHPPITAVVVVTVTSQEAVHNLPNVICLSFDQEMKMVCHQAIGVEEERQTDLLPSQQRKELVIVSRRIEYPAAIVTAREHVIETAL